jgi:hypothetical protein
MNFDSISAQNMESANVVRHSIIDENMRVKKGEENAKSFGLARISSKVSQQHDKNASKTLLTSMTLISPNKDLEKTEKEKQNQDVYKHLQIGLS